MFTLTGNYALATLGMPRDLAVPAYSTYVSWILSKKYYGKMKRR